MTGRAVKEWIGKTPDTPVPERVALRVFRKYDGRCHISGRKIGSDEAWEVEHVKPLSMGGENRESNLAPALVKPHKDKTREEASQRAKADRMAKNHLGLRKSKSRPMPGSKASGWRKPMNGPAERRT